MTTVSSRTRRALTAVLVLALLFIASTPTRAQQIDDFDRRRGKEMLNAIKRDIRDNYFDPSLKGIDIDARFKVAEDKIMTASSNGQIFGIIAQALMEFDDSHTNFAPPPRMIEVDYGISYQMIGDSCYVTGARPGSDAASKVKPGDKIVSLAGFKPTRNDMWKINYVISQIRPSETISLSLEAPDGVARKVDVTAKIERKKRVTNYTDLVDINAAIREAEESSKVYTHRMIAAGDVYVWKMPIFDLNDQDVDRIMGKAKGHKALVLDLRGNGGGLISTLQKLTGYFFEKDVKIADQTMRNKKEPLIAKGKGNDAFKGEVIVLVDHDSGSCSELLAKTLQLEKRAKVIGDRSAGAVMMSRFYGHQLGGNIVLQFGASVTNADLIMTDGKSLEKIGVAPDVAMVITAADMAESKDTVLAHAVKTLGGELSPEKAAALFPILWE